MFRRFIVVRACYVYVLWPPGLLPILAALGYNTSVGSQSPSFMAKVGRLNLHTAWHRALPSRAMLMAMGSPKPHL